MGFQRGPERRFRNQSAGHIGVVKVDRRGDKKGTPVAPGDDVLLTQEEIELTVKAPRNPAKNPFLPRDLLVIDPNDPTQTITQPGQPVLIEVPDDERELPPLNQAETPEGEPPAGSFAPQEETAVAPSEPEPEPEAELEQEPEDDDDPEKAAWLAAKAAEEGQDEGTNTPSESPPEETPRERQLREAAAEQAEREKSARQSQPGSGKPPA